MRKTREAGIRNIEYAHANILRFGSIGRSFDRIEAVGVLHHLAEPGVGWRCCCRCCGLAGSWISACTARQGGAVSLPPAPSSRSAGIGATAEDIRRLRREVHPGTYDFAKDLLTSADFCTTSACRDLLFHVMEHRFNIPDIAAFLSENKLAFLGFRLMPEVVDRFRRQFPDPAAVTSLAGTTSSKPIRGHLPPYTGSRSEETGEAGVHRARAAAG